MMTNPRLLIDAEGFLFRAVAAAEYEAHWGDGVIVASTNLEQAKDMFTSQIKHVCDTLKSDDVVYVLSGDDNFRYKLTDDYKSNRKGNRKPLGYLALVDWLMERDDTTVVRKDVLEADDYLGILATKPGAPPSIIVSDDKDLKTIPGQLYRLGELSSITEDEADRNWWSQVLTGDPADGYKGCPGIGAVRAEKILSKPGSRWENVRQEFLKAGLTEEYAVLQARLARILQYSDWDSANQNVKLWTPPTA